MNKFIALVIVNELLKSVGRIPLLFHIEGYGDIFKVIDIAPFQD